MIRARRGRQKFVDYRSFLAHESIRDKAAKTPAPPRIQTLLKQAHEFMARLAANSELTRHSLARQHGLNPAQLTRILHLASLAPEIQEHILALPPIKGRSLFTERRLRQLARIGDHDAQMLTFRTLLRQPVRAPRQPAASTITSTPVAPIA